MCEHSHEHTHAHTHEHTHADGTTHVHEHDHTHSHEHEHPHGHEHDHDHEHAHDHDHTHEHHHHDHAVDATPKEELVAMLKYMVGHNASHVRETQELAEQLKAESPAVYEKIVEAVAVFEDGNSKLADALADLLKED